MRALFNGNTLLDRLKLICNTALGRTESEDAFVREYTAQHEFNYLPAKVQTKDVQRHADGAPVLPFNAKGAMIEELGEIVFDSKHFHSRTYIWPLGFRSVRKMASVLNANKQVEYVSTIDEQAGKPLFVVQASDTGAEWSGSTASGAWMKALRSIKHRQQVSVSGPEMFGFSEPAVKMLIQELPNARKCANYEFLEFENSVTNPQETRDVEEDDDDAYEPNDSDARDESEDAPVPAAEALQGKRVQKKKRVW